MIERAEVPGAALPRRAAAAAGTPKALPPVRPGGAVAAALGVALAATVLTPLWNLWRGDSSLSHGPLLWLIAGVLLWSRREELRRWDAAWGPGCALLVGSALLHVAAVWGDIAFLKPFSFLLMIAGGAAFLGGRTALGAVAGPLGLTTLSLPWPTTLVSSLSFPLQLTSSAYSALFAGMLGLPIQRSGVYVSVMSEAGDKPVYSMMVAAACSGLTSVMVLLALGYLVAYLTPVRWWWRAAMVAGMVPLALFANAVRLTVILVAGANYSAEVAQWVHDHEQPFLITLCSLGMIGARQALLALDQRAEGGAEAAAEAPSPLTGTQEKGNTSDADAVAAADAAPLLGA